MKKPLILLGGGEQAAVIAEVLLSKGRNLVGVVSLQPIKSTSPLAGIRRLVSDDELLKNYSPEDIKLVNGIGAIPGQGLRWELFDYYSNHGYRFANVVGPEESAKRMMVRVSG